ncbi:hypothetical protein M407DRAFT_245062 [Tulasnella calospora MUT 4182]|uniref:Uncharacterized protein n=1 Tax=Tulasnella calospora MUT 4182 TaxID=1051891 RepID=A0A0C3QBX6_9AGAM|nr:hypothetical protein M407DRAFT_245062 [Tulasnella calospora MUT 4182]
MAGKKRAADGEATATSSRRSKAVKVSDGEHSSPGAKPASTAKKPVSTSKKPASAAKKAPAAEEKTIVPTSDQFLEHALPLHVHVTHTPPTSEVPGSSTDPTPNMSTDPGFVASMTLAPGVFGTGSFGWKGSRRVAVELQNADGKKEKVMVMMSLNATVVGSKPGSKAPSSSKGKKPAASKSKKKKKEEEEEEDDDDDEDDD